MSVSELSLQEAVKSKLYADNRYTRFLEKLEKNCKLNREVVFIVLVVIMGLYLSIGRGAEIICNLCGAIYPACASVSAVENKDTHMIKRLLVYWVIFASFKLLEFFSKFLISWIPFYWALKMAILIACFSPTKDNISTHIFDKFMEPLLKEDLKKDNLHGDPSAETTESSLTTKEE